MTVPYSTRQSVDYAGPQSAGHDYEFDFRLHDESMLQVFINDGTTESEVDSSDYSVTLNLDQYTNAGGKVTLTAELAGGSTLFIRSNLTIEQSSQLSASPNYSARAVEDALDYLTMCLLDEHRSVEEAVVASEDSAAAANAAADSASESAASAAALSTLQEGTPTNDVIAAGISVQQALWKLQGQTLAARNIAFINTDAVTVGATTYTMTAEESAAAVWIFYGGTSDCTVTPVYNSLTQGIKKITTTYSAYDITIEGHVFGGVAYGAVDAYIIHDGTFGISSLTEGAANSRVVEQNGTTYNLDDLTNGTYNYFSYAGAVTLTVQPESPTVVIPENAAYEIERRGAVDLEIIAGSGVTIIPPKGGSLFLEDGDFVVLKRTGVDTYKLVGSTQ